MDELGLSDEERAALEGFVALVRESPHNLMGPRALEELWSRHVPECVHLARLLPDIRTVLDLGSGGGFPGVVIAIVRPDLEVTLLEATEKKARFLEQVVVELGLEAPVVNARAEEVQGLEGRFQAVTARAVADLATLAGWSVPLLAPDGVLYAVKGRTWEQDLEDARETLDTLGCTVLATPDPSVTDADTRPRVVMIAQSERTGRQRR